MTQVTQLHTEMLRNVTVTADPDSVLLQIQIPTNGSNIASRLNRKEADKVAEAILGEDAFVVRGKLPEVRKAPFNGYIRTTHYEMGKGADPEEALSRAKEFLALHTELVRIRDEREEAARLEKERKEAEKLAKLTKLRDEVAQEIDPAGWSERTYENSTHIVQNAIDIIIAEREHRS